VWSPFAEDTKYFQPSQKPFMLNFAVDDLDGFLAMLASKGVEVLDRQDDDSNGRFAWIMDSDGNKIELWEPKR
jgi:predicted enzyme related to lactoylglutathione lyase